MLLNTLDVKLTPRTNIKPYRVKINPATLKILTLLFEFKLATSWQMSRFLSQTNMSRYVYTKLRRMWQARLLESLKVFSGSVAGVPLYYMLSKKALAILADQGLYEIQDLKTYPKAKTLLSWGLFKHEAQIVELASLESLNKSKALDISFKGEFSSQSQDFMDDKTIEALTPDYTVIYKTGGDKYLIYTEFERTRKSDEALLNKIQRYLKFLSQQDPKKHIIRLIFQTPKMEQSFWLNIILNKPGLLKLNIVTSNLELTSGHKQFLQPIYAAESTVKLTKSGKLGADMSQRIKLLPFL